MTLKEILSARSDDGILVKLLLRHPRQIDNLPQAIEALHELRDTDVDNPERDYPEHFSWFRTIVHKKEGSDGKPANWEVIAEGYPILGLDPITGMIRDLSWDSVLSRDVVYKVHDETVEIQTLTEDEQNELLAAILYEMTWDHFSDKERRRKRVSVEDELDGHI